MMNRRDFVKFGLGGAGLAAGGGCWIKTGAGTQSLQYFHVDILGESDYRFILMV